MAKSEKEFYGKNYNYVMKKKKENEALLKNFFKKKYPYTYMSKFSFESDFSPDGVFKGYHVWFKNNDMISTDVFKKGSNLSELSDTFKNSPEMLKYFTLGKPVEHFPKIWKLGGSIQKLPRGKRHVGFYGKSYYWDEFPTEYVLNYHINQFRIYANNTDYFQSQLP